MSRKRLPNRRAARRFTFILGKMNYEAGLGYYPDGRLGEIFITCGKTGSDANLAMLESAIAASFALQHGCSVETLAAALPRRTDKSAEGPLGRLLDLLKAEDIRLAEEELLR